MTYGDADPAVVSDSLYDSSYNQTRIELRPYIDSMGQERVVWRIGNTTGNNGVLDKRESQVFLPQGREVNLDITESTRQFPIPRWMCDALMEEFSQLHEKITIQNITEIAPHTRVHSTDEYEAQFRAYSDGENIRLIWKIDGETGENAVYESSLECVLLPTDNGVDSELLEGFNQIPVSEDVARQLNEDMKSLSD